jgi:hypothetical protein
MHRSEVDRWLAGYIEAWRTYDRERIAALFSVDASTAITRTTNGSAGATRS